MFDSGWELIEGEEAHAIETLNYLNQVNVIEGIFRLFAYHSPPGARGCERVPSCHTLRELHRTGTLFLLAKPGEYRVSEVVVANGETVVHRPPTCDELDDEMSRFERELNARWLAFTAIEAAAFALWRINWVHPFKNGNGRSARAFAYACLTLKLGFLLPGRVTVIDLIMDTKPAFEAALRTADATFKAKGDADLTELARYLTELLALQLSSVVGEPAVAEVTA